MLRYVTGSNFQGLSRLDKSRLIKEELGRSGTQDVNVFEQLRKIEGVSEIIDTTHRIRQYEKALKNAIYVEKAAGKYLAREEDFDKLEYRYESKKENGGAAVKNGDDISKYSLYSIIDILEMRSKSQIEAVAKYLIAGNEFDVLGPLNAASRKLDCFTDEDAAAISRRIIELFKKSCRAVYYLEKDKDHVTGGGEDDFYKDNDRLSTLARRCYKFLSKDDKDDFDEFLGYRRYRELFKGGLFNSSSALKIPGLKVFRRGLYSFLSKPFRLLKFFFLKRRATARVKPLRYDAGMKLKTRVTTPVKPLYDWLDAGMKKAISEAKNSGFGVGDPFRDVRRAAGRELSSQRDLLVSSRELDRVVSRAL